MLVGGGMAAFIMAVLSMAGASRKVKRSAAIVMGVSWLMGVTWMGWPPSLESVEIGYQGVRGANGSLTLIVGVPVQFDLAANQSNHEVARQLQDVSWSCSNGNASVTKGGIVTGFKPGATVLRAEYRGRTAELPITVSDAKIKSIHIAPPGPEEVDSSGFVLGATGTFADGTVHDMADLCLWSSSDPKVVTIPEHGDNFQYIGATPMGPGTAKITASYGGVQGSVTVTRTRPRQN